jgi:hypothetical protein
MNTLRCGCRDKSGRNAEQMIKMRVVLSKKLSLLDRNIRDFLFKRKPDA